MVRSLPQLNGGASVPLAGAAHLLLCLLDYYLEWHSRTDHRVAATGGAAGRRTALGRRDQSRNGTAKATNNGIAGRKMQYWVIPPEVDAEFAARVEEVQGTYECPSDPQHTAVCRTDRPARLVQETHAAAGYDGASRAR